MHCLLRAYLLDPFCRWPALRLCQHAGRLPACPSGTAPAPAERLGTRHPLNTAAVAGAGPFVLLLPGHEAVQRRLVKPGTGTAYTLQVADVLSA